MQPINYPGNLLKIFPGKVKGYVSNYCHLLPKSQKLAERADFVIA